jgi:hypothetical protein
MTRYGIRVITDEYIQQQQERYAMAKNKARKKALKPFPDTDRDERIPESLADLYDEAVAAQKREAAMGTPAVDGSRFPSATAKGI